MNDIFFSAAFIIAITEVVKRATNLSKRFLPLVAILFGILIFGFGRGFIVDNIFMGILVGLISSGIFSGSKAILNK